MVKRRKPNLDFVFSELANLGMEDSERGQIAVQALLNWARDLGIPSEQFIFGHGGFVDVDSVAISILEKYC